MSSLATSSHSPAHLPTSQPLSHSFPTTNPNILPPTFASLKSSENCFSTKRGRTQLGSTWDDIPALVNLIVALAVDDAEQNTEVTMSPSEKNRSKKFRSEQLDLTENDLQANLEPP